MHAKPLQTYTLGVAFGILSCGGSADHSTTSSGAAADVDRTAVDPAGGGSSVVTGGSGGGSYVAGGSRNTGNSQSNETNTSSQSFGGTLASSLGSSSEGGRVALGGSVTGGVAASGKSAAAGGVASGGTVTGGKSATHRDATGGVATAGKATTGGAATGGKATTGGAATGGKATTGGAATGGAGTVSTLTSDPCSSVSALTGGTQHCNENTSGSYGSYQWKVWSNRTTGCITTYAGDSAAFSATWDNSGDFIAGVGLPFDGTKTHQELGVFSADFAESKSGSSGPYSYIGAYGLTAEPSVEFYIVEDSFNSPLSSLSGIKLGIVEADGGIYDVYKNQISGTTLWTQFFSVRRTSRHCGHLSLSAHFSKWADLGLELGKMREVSIFVEADGGKGSVDFTTVSVVVDASTKAK